LLHFPQYVFLSLGVSFPCLFHQAAFRFWFAKGYAYLFSISTLFDYSSIAREAKAVVMSKDEDFRRLVDRLGAPPQVLWVTCGNTSNARLREILQQGLPAAIDY